jgi:hypothetical protein
MTDFLKHKFTQKDIDTYISIQAEESINLDFKRGEALKLDDKTKKNIAKDVSSFANSDGGVIIYGIEEKNFKADSLAFVNGNEITKEWLEQIISSRIQRKIDGVLIDPIRYNSKIEQTIYVVKIPRSLGAPHMTSEKDFYKRYNFQSVKMEEYEVRNLYTRQGKTKLSLEIPKITGEAGAFMGGGATEVNTIVQINVLNTGESIEKLYKVVIHIPKLVALHSNQYGEASYYKHLSRHEDIYSIFAIPNNSPLFQNELATVINIKLNINRQNFPDIENNEILIQLFYTNGIEEKRLNLIDDLDYGGRKLTIDDFRKH